MLDDMKKHLKCFNKDPHPSHEWTFFYDRPVTEYICPGIEEEK